MRKILTLTILLISFCQFSNAQNVGIGETNPSSKLEIKTNSSINYPQLTLMEDENDYSRLNFSSTAQPNSFWTIAAKPISIDLEGRMNFYYQTKGDLMTLTTNGDLGIGTTNPRARLNVKSTESHMAMFEGGNNMFMSIHENGNYLGYWGSLSGSANDIDFGTGSGSTAKLHLTTNVIPRLTIDKDGNVGIGTTTPQHLMHISGNSLFNGTAQLSLQENNPTDFARLKFENTGVNSYWDIAAHNDATPGNARLNFYHEGVGDVLSLQGDGDVTVKGEVNRPSTGAANMVPVCYGIVDRDGIIKGGSGNFTVSNITPDDGEYRITINGENYDENTYVTVLTCVGGSPGTFTTNGLAGALVVRIYKHVRLGPGPTPHDLPFSFVVYHP